MVGLYSAAAFWAQLVRGVWSGSPMAVGWLNIPGGFGLAGKFSSVAFSKRTNIK
jgi:hypothetical protein